MDESRGLVRRILIGALLLAAGLAVGGHVLSGQTFALSVVVGAGLACGSFFMLQRDIHRLMERLGAGDGSAALSGMEQGRFLIRALGRFVVLALVLFALAAQMTIHPVGLVLGLTTPVPGVIMAALAGKRKRLSGIP